MGSALTGFCGFSEGPVSEYYFVFASYTSVIAVYQLGLSLAVKLLTAAWVLSELAVRIRREPSLVLAAVPVPQRVTDGGHRPRGGESHHAGRPCVHCPRRVTLCWVVRPLRIWRQLETGFVQSGFIPMRVAFLNSRLTEV